MALNDLHTFLVVCPPGQSHHTEIIDKNIMVTKMIARENATRVGQITNFTPHGQASSDRIGNTPKEDIPFLMKANTNMIVFGAGNWIYICGIEVTAP